MAKTMILPAALRHLQLGDGINIDGLNAEVRGLATDLIAAIGKLEEANTYPDGIQGLELAEYARDSQIAAMAEVREVADKLEGVVADDLWPLPKYSEILFVR
jgi:glutamine synthetase